MASSTPAAAAKDCDMQSAYENHNMVDYGPLNLSTLMNGIARDRDGSPIRRACVLAFMEMDNDHVLLARTEADNNGRFRLVLKHGHYRVVVKSPGLCAANIPVHVVDRATKQLVVHIKPSRLDSCSYGDYK
jgi:hypothetical protein